MRYELFEEVFSISSNDIREHDKVRVPIEGGDETKKVFVFFYLSMMYCELLKSSLVSIFSVQNNAYL